MSSVNTISNASKSPNKIVDFITSYETLVVFGGFGSVIILTIILTGIFQSGPRVRDSVLYNAFGALLLAAIFVYVIYRFIGNKVTILGSSFDFGMIIYASIVLFIMFVLGN